MAGKRSRAGAFTHGNKIAAALAFLASGQARSKDEAAKMAGISRHSLSPGRLTHHTDNSPALRAPLRVELLQITGLVDGERMSLAAGLSGACETAAGIIGALRNKLNKLTASELRALKRAQETIRFAKECGLFAAVPGSSTGPGEVAAARETMTQADYLLEGDHRSPGRRAMRGMLTVRQPAEAPGPDTEPTTAPEKVLPERSDEIET